MGTPKNAGMWPGICHLAMLAGMVIPLGNILGPLGIWLWKRESDAEVEYHGREALNFQLSVSLYSLIYLILLIPLVIWFVVNPTDSKAQLMLWVIPLALVPFALFTLVTLLLSIFAAIKANGGVRFRYPATIRFVKTTAAPPH